MVAKQSTEAIVSEEKIRAIAHQLWVEAGQPEGQAEEHWFKAIEVASIKAAKAVKAKPAVNKAPVTTAAPKTTAKKPPKEKVKP